MSEVSFLGDNEKCAGCPALQKSLAAHTILDYEFEEECDILFISDSPKMFEGDWQAFRPQEYGVLARHIRKLGIRNTHTVGYTTAVKCPSITMDTLSPAIRKTCRAHLEDTIDHYKPKLVFACGKLATTMLYGKVRADSKVRGKADTMTTDKGFEFRVVPTMHPFQVVSEPKNDYLFSTDLENAVNNELLGKSSDVKLPYTLVMSNEDLEPFKESFTKTEHDIAVDIETTGLSFLADTIHTISLTRVDRDRGEVLETIVLPIDHKEAKIGYAIKAKFMKFISSVMRNKKNRKILQNAGFDLKFLKRYGVTEVHNVWDTKLMQHLYKEDVPKSLADLVYYYFPEDKF
jgi:uracil-DNA glycosylase family 4